MLKRNLITCLCSDKNKPKTSNNIGHINKLKTRILWLFPINIQCLLIKDSSSTRTEYYDVHP